MGIFIYDILSLEFKLLRATELSETEFSPSTNFKVAIDLYPTGSSGNFDVFINYKEK